MQTEFKVTSERDGLELYGIIVKPEGEIRGIIQIAHGMCEHKGRYIPFMEYMAGHGYACVINDHRGHGQSVKSPEDLGYFYEDGAAALVDDLHLITLYAKKELGESLPFTLLGHSMGSLAVRCYAKKYDADIDRLVVVGSPSSNATAGLGLALIRGLKKVKGDRNRSAMINGMVMGPYEKRFKAEKLEHAWLNSDAEAVREYNRDELCGFVFTLNGFENLLLLLEGAYSKKGWDGIKKELPVIFMSGKDDPCAVSDKDFAAAIRSFKDHGYENVTGKFYKNMRHEILNEKRKLVVYRDLLDFLEDAKEQ